MASDNLWRATLCLRVFLLDCGLDNTWYWIQSSLLITPQKPQLNPATEVGLCVACVCEPISMASMYIYLEEGGVSTLGNVTDAQGRYGEWVAYCVAAL